jgi:peptidoglycan/LPS O-acetylase OafA/YrhL
MLRGIAALCVVGLHLQWINADHPRVFGKGFLAVDLFFMLSGYVMARTYEPRFAQGLSSLRFLAARYRRLWPIMAVGSVIGLPKLFGDLPDITAFLVTAACNIMLLPTPIHNLAFPLNIPAWSIFFELAVNLAHALILWRFGIRWLLALVTVAVAVMAWVGLSYGTIDIGAHGGDYFVGTARATLSYVIGIVLWRWWRDRPSLGISPALAFAAMPLIFASAWLLGIDDWRLDLSFIVAACPLLIAGGLRFGHSEGVLASTAAALGALSFPLYAVHMPVIQGMRMLGFGSIWGGLTALASGIALALAAEIVGTRRKQHRRKTA